MKKDHIIAGLDIGSTKVSVIIGTMGMSGLDVIGIGTAPTDGLRKGAVVNIESTTEAIKKAREEAELMAGVQLHDVWVSVGGNHLKSFDSKGIVAITGKEVTRNDVVRVVEAAKTVAVPLDRQVLHVLPRDFKIDDQDGIFDPIGMSGVRLEANVHIITGGQTALQNLTKCTERANLKVAGLVVQQLASAMSVLSEDERRLGVILVDIGGGTSDIIVYSQGSVAYTASLPVGGSHLVNDVAIGLRTPHSFAEELIKKYGCALTSLVNAEETIEVEGVGGRKERTIFRQHLCEVIEPRAEEILNLINNEIQKCTLGTPVGSGIVITGGVSQLEGISELGEFCYDMPVRKGSPQYFGGLTDVVRSPQYATAVGVLLYALGRSKGISPVATANKMLDRWVTRVKEVIDDVF